MKLSNTRLKRTNDGPDIVSTKFSGSFENRLGKTKPVYIFAGLTPHDRPLVKIRIREGGRGLTTSYPHPLHHFAMK